MAKLDYIRRKAKIGDSQQEAIEKAYFAKKEAPGSYEMVPIDKIDPDPDNPRKSMDPKRLQEMAASITEKGVIHPLNLLQVDGQRFKVEEGHRRLEASKIAGKTHVPAIIIMDGDLTEEEVRERQLIENLHNEDLPPIDAGRAIKAVQDKHNLSVRKVAKKIALPHSTVQDYVGILRIPDELLETCQGLPLKKLIPISSAPLDDMPSLIEAARSGSTSEQVKTLQREKKPLSYFRQSYKLKSWIEKKSGNEVIVKLKDVDPDEDASALVSKTLSRLAKEIRKGS